MRAEMWSVPPELIAWRKQTGAHQWDEMWDGVLHMGPSPNRIQQDLEGLLETWLRNHWMPRTGGRVYHQINVAPPGGWPERNYRIPDLVILTPDRFWIDKIEYFEGAPAAVVEIRSPEDETYQKLPFYAALGVPEVWVIDRDTRAPEIHVLQMGDYTPAPPLDDGWLASAIAGVQLRQASPGKVALRIADGPETERVIPD